MAEFSKCFRSENLVAVQLPFSSAFVYMEMIRSPRFSRRPAAWMVLSHGKTARRNLEPNKFQKRLGINPVHVYVHNHIYIYMIPVRGSLPPPPPPHMVWSQNLRFAAFRMKTLYLQCFLHGGLLVRSATRQIRWIFATNLPKTCYLQCFGLDIVE